MNGETTQFSSPDERRAILALTTVADVGPVNHRKLSERFGSASRALTESFPATVVRAAYARADSLLVKGERAALQLTTIGDEAYPPQLQELHDPPPVLWSRGDWSHLRPPIVSIVGTRRATSYGLRVTRELASALTRAGACVVSGMALGIDGCAHRAALDAGGSTVAVLGTGADIVYPHAHKALYREIIERGLILSELEPGDRADGGSFKRRNRIIAGLARLTIVVEAPFSSGALNTAESAVNLGRELAAVPGPIDSPQSQGTNDLIRECAHPVISIAEALHLIGLSPPVRIEPELHGEEEARIWVALEEAATSLDELCARSKLPVARCLTAVTGLEMRGVVECELTGAIRRRR